MVIDRPDSLPVDEPASKAAHAMMPPKVEARVACLPTLHGEQVVIRLALSTIHEWQLPQLGLTDDSLRRLRAALGLSSGVVLISGPAGSGKTTSAYAAVRELLADVEARSIVSLEDPVECEIAGVAQSQINPSAGYDWSTGLKAVLRQDAEAMFIGEIRDAETAAIAFQAAMTGQLVLTTMHARSSVDCLQRLLDMGVPYQHLRGGLNLLSCQRLIPRRCRCQQQSSPQHARCEHCGGSGSDGLLLLSENLPALDGELARSLTVEADVLTLQAAALSQGMVSLAESAAQALEKQWILESDVARYI